MPKLEHPSYLKRRWLRRQEKTNLEKALEIAGLNNGIFGGLRGGGVNAVGEGSNGNGGNRDSQGSSNANKASESASTDPDDGTSPSEDTGAVRAPAISAGPIIPAGELAAESQSSSPTITDDLSSPTMDAINPGAVMSPDVMTETYVTYGVATYTVGSSTMTTQFPFTFTAVMETSTPRTFRFRRTASTGAIVGAVFGAIAVFALTAVFCIYFPKLRRRRRDIYTRPDEKRDTIGSGYSMMLPEVTGVTSPGLFDQFPKPPAFSAPPIIAKWLTYPQAVAKKGLAQVARLPPVAYAQARMQSSSSVEKHQSEQSYYGRGSLPFAGFSLKPSRVDFDDPSPSEPDTDAYRDMSDDGMGSLSSPKR